MSADNRATEPPTAIESLRLAAEVAGVWVPEFVVPDDHQVILSGLRFHYLDWGTRGAPILWLHGGALNAHTYDLVCLAMRDKYRSVALDQRGHGDSEWSPMIDYSYESHAADVAALIDHLGWTRFILVGMSMGGLNSIAYAARHAGRLAGLVLIDVGPDVRTQGTTRIREFTEVQALGSVEEFVDRAMEFNPRRNPVLLRRSLLHNLRQTPDGRWTWKWDPRPRDRTYLQKNADELRRRSQLLWEDVDQIECPTLVVRGAESDVFLDEDAETLAKRFKHGRWSKVPGAGHTVQGDNPVGLIDSIRRFLDDIGY